MPLRRHLLVIVALLLALCLVVAGALTYWHGLRKIELEMTSALQVGESAVADTIATLPTSADPTAHLHRVVASFDGDRHLKAMLKSRDGKVVHKSRVRPPVDPAPAWLYRLLSGPEHVKTFPVLPGYENLAELEIRADPRNEIGEVWEDLKLKFLIISGFCAVVLAMIYATVGWALRPLEKLSAALSKVGAGDYSPKLAETGPEELREIYKSFNRMAQELEAAENQNRRLNEQLTTVQEEERAEIARDLHDEIGPFLFAVDVDAQSIPQLVEAGANDEVKNRGRTIRQSVQHMQMHLRNILSRLRPATFIDQGLTHAADQLVAFWQARRGAIQFQMEIDDQRYPANIEEAAFRVLQEGTSNAVRHGKPSTIGLSAKSAGDVLRIVVSDDGAGIVNTSRKGFGLVGLRERVAALEGRLWLAEAPPGPKRGVTLIAEIPIPSAGRKPAIDKATATSAA